MKGTVKWFNDAKGFGFISSDQDEEIFVHFSAIQTRGFRSLQEGARVAFDRLQGPKGYQAGNVRVIPAEEESAVPKTPVNNFDELAVMLVDGRLRVVAMSRDGECQYVDPLRQHHGILYLATSETAALAAAVEEFEDLINRADTKEHQLQDFFERNHTCPKQL